MEWSVFFHSAIFAYVILPILIFCSRIVDVSIGTMRVIFITKGYRMLAPLFGFFEVLIWLIAVTQIMQHLSQPLYYVAYAGGFAAGNFVGMLIESRMALGVVLVRIITPDDVTELLDHLKARNYGVTAVDAKGLYENVKILFTIIKRAEVNNVIKSVEMYHPQAFYTIEDVRIVSGAAQSVRGEGIPERSGSRREILQER